MRAENASAENGDWAKFEVVRLLGKLLFLLLEIRALSLWLRFQAGGFVVHHSRTSAG